jgi:hypothetical protein
MTNPKLALIPSGYKALFVYSILPNNADGDFAYERNGSATRVRKDGLIEELTVNDTPRLDWLNSDCPSLLLEPQRTNIQAYSENFSGAAWTPALVTITANSSVSPNGELTAYKIESDQTNFAAELSGFLSITSNTEYTYSIYVKADTTSICRIELTDNLNSSDYYYGRADFDMSTETLTTSLATASFDRLDGGWYRLKMTATSPNPIQGSTRAKIILPEVGSIFIWGAQTEAGGYATSYIKNVDNANGVTRLKDECINGGDADLFDITEGTFFVDAVNFSPLLNDYSMITLSDGSTNIVRFLYESSRIRVTVIASNNVEQDYFIAGVASNQRNKVALTFKKDEFKVYHNGVLKDTDTSGDIPTGLDRLNFSMTNNLSRWFEGKVHDTRVYDRVLTEAEAITLTTI